MWFDHVKIQGAQISGTLANEPDLARMKFGTPITISLGSLEDWLYVKDNRLRGTFSIRVPRGRMTPEERKKFNAELGMPLN